MTLLILPKNFKGFLCELGQCQENHDYFHEELAKEERVLFFDSVCSLRQIPKALKDALLMPTTLDYTVEEGTDQEKITTPYSVYVPAVLSAGTIFKNFASSAQQANNIDCGYWACYNGVMTLLGGSYWFYADIYMIKNHINKSKKSMDDAGRYMRQLFRELLKRSIPVVSHLDKMNSLL